MDAQIVIVGAGPAGALLAYLMASRGIDTLLLERQRDFAREFRGEVLMPSGVRALAEAGIDLDAVATVRPAVFEAYLRGRCFMSAEVPAGETAVPTAVSQPQLLEHLVARAEATGHFELRRGAAVRGLEVEGRGISLRVQQTGADSETRIESPFLVGADGRSSIVRRRLDPEVRTRSNPMDVVWMKLPPPVAWKKPRARFELGNGHILLSYIAPDGLLQVAWVILKGTYGTLRNRGMDDWAKDLARHADPELGAHIEMVLADSAGRAAGEDDHPIQRPFLLDCVTDRVLGWSRTRALLIGDAAHTMSPVGAQGLNLALRDAIVAANLLVPALRNGHDPTAAAARVEALRGPEIDRIQRFAAIPPRLMMGRTVFHSALRRALAFTASRLPIREGIARSPILSAFLNGSTRVELEV